ncbi:MAG: class I SAM-dependent methyltransferase [Muribaculaceae bacterium]|nr:class I SAM-dependent methyltransferase [Muribaculaceae bacterium]
MIPPSIVPTIIGADIEEYIERHIDAEPAHLQQLNRDTRTQLLYGHMCSGHIQGRILKMIVRMVNPELVLELGTYSGYSAQCLAEGLLSPTAHVHTIEIDDEQEDFITSHLAKSPVASRVTLHIGDAIQVLPELGLMFDLVFIDANKRNYVDFYELALKYTRQGGFIVADNTLWGGKVAKELDKLDAQTQGVMRFNDLVAEDPRVETAIIPIRDGLTILYKK